MGQSTLVGFSFWVQHFPKIERSLYMKEKIAKFFLRKKTKNL
jgi:hypothetical protein